MIRKLEMFSGKRKHSPNDEEEAGKLEHAGNTGVGYEQRKCTM